MNYYESFANAGDALNYALPTALFGFFTVFFVLALLWGIIALMKVFFYTIPEKKKHASNGTPAASGDNVAKMQTISADGAAAAVLPETELIAVITAAVSAFRAASGEAVNGFRVVSFKKRK